MTTQHSKNTGSNAILKTGKITGTGQKAQNMKGLPKNWNCPIGNEPLFNGEKIETHHIVPVKQGGSDDTENLVHLHAACHKQVHSKSKKERLEVRS